MLIHNSSFLDEHWEVLIIFPPKGFLFFQALYQDRKILLCYLLPCHPCSVLSITQNTHFLDFFARTHTAQPCHGLRKFIQGSIQGCLEISLNLIVCPNPSSKPISCIRLSLESHPSFLEDWIYLFQRAITSPSQLSPFITHCFQSSCL